MAQFYAPGVANGVVGSVKKRHRLPRRSFFCVTESNTSFFTLRQTRFFTRDRYDLDEEFSFLAGFLIGKPVTGQEKESIRVLL